MTAEEIRSCNTGILYDEFESKAPSTKDFRRAQCQMLQEIAAQLAEMNGWLSILTAPLRREGEVPAIPEPPPPPPASDPDDIPF